MNGDAVCSRYHQNGIESADPISLILRLYDAMEKDLGSIRENISSGGSKDELFLLVTRTRRILRALSDSVESDSEGEIAGNLLALYEYMIHQSMNIVSATETVSADNILRVLATLRNGWEGIDRRKIRAEMERSTSKRKDCSYLSLRA